MLQHWALDPDVTYLNHGTVGAPPRRALEEQQRLRDEIEKQPSLFLLRLLAGVRLGAKHEGRPKLRQAADEVAAFLGARGEDMVFVDNATTGVNAVLQSFDFRESDEILILDHAYGATRNAVEYAARRAGAVVRTVELGSDFRSDGDVTNALVPAIGPRTRMAVVDHIASDSAVVMPVEEMAAACHKRGVAILVDAAHAPGAIPVDIPSLGVDWYAGNLHKWAWAPRSSGVLWTRPPWQPSLHHPVVSWGVNQGIAMEFDLPGTRDPTPHLAAPAGIAFMRELGVENVQRYNHELAWNAAAEMANRWDTRTVAPQSMTGPMASLFLPERLASTREETVALRDALLFEDRIEVHVNYWKDRALLRVSGQIYNDGADIERLIAAIDRRLAG
ncbi:MAG TPA: aminotransferase class V-fold PLP-dependent enzyme [Terriglobia bacterium]|nr:aminotransferase class V-fold PLP-dependent enzyme [Terriglobia bacterium]